jgi:hypothetical protein
MPEKPDLRTLSKLSMLEEKDTKSLASYSEQSAQTDALQGIEKLLTPVSSFADIITKHAEGVFMGELREQVEEATKKASEKLEADFNSAREDIEGILDQAFSSENDTLKEEIKSQAKEALEDLKSSSLLYIDDNIQKKADEMFSNLSELARLTPDEIAEIEDHAALSVESQIAGIIGEYVDEYGVSTDQVRDLDSFVRSRIPQLDLNSLTVDWRNIRNVPELGGGGAGTRAVKWLNDITNADTASVGQVLTKNSNGTYSFTSAGAGDMTAAMYDPAGKEEQVLTESDILDEDDMASNSATKVPSQQSVKAYVDAQGGGGGVAESLVIAYSVSL